MRSNVKPSTVSHFIPESYQSSRNAPQWSDRDYQQLRFHLGGATGQVVSYGTLAAGMMRIGCACRCGRICSPHQARLLRLLPPPDSRRNHHGLDVSVPPCKIDPLFEVAAELPCTRTQKRRYAFRIGEKKKPLEYRGASSYPSTQPKPGLCTKMAIPRLIDIPAKEQSLQTAICGRGNWFACKSSVVVPVPVA